MKKIITILCIFALTLSLFGCGSKPRYPENYSVGEHEGHWSILYTDEDGVEEIAALGDYQQPLVLQKGRLWFVQNGALVTVDPEGEERLETPLDGLASGSGAIFHLEGDSLYCIDDRAAQRCWRISLTDQNDWDYITLPRSLRAVDYDGLTADILTAVKAKEDTIRVRSARMELDSNGSVVAMELDILAYDRIANNMRTWNSGVVTVQMTLDGPQVRYTDLYIPVSVSQATVKPFMKLQTLLGHVASVDSAELATKHAAGTAEGFVLTYKTEDYEAAAKSSAAAALDLTGAETKANLSKQHLVLAQVGGCDTALTDSAGANAGNLIVVQMG